MATLSQVAYLALSSSDKAKRGTGLKDYVRKWVERSDDLCFALHKILCDAEEENIQRRCLGIFSYLLYNSDIRSHCVDWYYYDLDDAKRNIFRHAAKKSKSTDLYYASISALRNTVTTCGRPQNADEAVPYQNVAALVEAVSKALNRTPEKPQSSLSQDDTDDTDDLDLRLLESSLWNLYKLSDTAKGRTNLDIREIDFVSVANLLNDAEYKKWQFSAQLRLIESTALMVTILTRLLENMNPEDISLSDDPLRRQFDSVIQIASKFLDDFSVQPGSGTKEDRALWRAYTESFRKTVDIARGSAKARGIPLVESAPTPDFQSVQAEKRLPVLRRAKSRIVKLWTEDEIA